MKRIPSLLLASAMITLNLSACRKKGCTDEIAHNYNKEATYEDGSCEYTYGCIDPEAVNYDSTANVDDRSCQYEFIADNTTFSDWANWARIDSNFGLDPAMLGAHGSDDSTVIREVFMNPNVSATDSLYPRGTMLVKYSRSIESEFSMITAMVKRGNEYQPDHNDWEWFILNTDGSIALDSNGLELRGENIVSLGCPACHKQANVDFVFSK